MRGVYESRGVFMKILLKEVIDMNENKIFLIISIIFAMVFLLLIGMILYSINTLVKAQGETSPQINIERSNNYVK